MNVPQRAVILASALLCWMGSALVAQSYYGPLTVLPVEGAPGSVYQRAQAADLMPYGRPSGLVLDGEGLYVLRNPMVFRDADLLPGSATDFDVLSEGSPEGHDAVVCADPGVGLALRWYDWATATYQQSWITTAPAWSAIRGLEVVDVDLDGDEDIVGLRADGSALEILYDVGGTWTPAQGLLSVAATEMVPVEWSTSSQGLEFGLITAAGVDVVALDGTALATASGTTDALTRVPRAPEDQLVRVFRAAGSTQYLELLAEDDPTESTVLGASGVTAMVADDVNQDGLADLILNHTLNYHNLLLANQGPGGSTFNLLPGSYGFVAMSAAPGNPNNVARGVFHDFDRDGDNDYLLPIQGDDEAHLLPSWLVDQGQYRCVAKVTLADVVFGGQNGWEFHFKIKFPEPAIVDPDATHLDVWTYHQYDVNGPIDSTPYAFRSIDLQGPNGLDWPPERSETYVLNDPRVTFEAVYWFVLQVVERAGDGTLAKAYAPHIFAVCVDDDVFQVLINLPGAGTPKWFATEGGGHGGAEGPPNGGGTVPLPNLPNSFGGTGGGD